MMRRKRAIEMYLLSVAPKCYDRVTTGLAIGNNDIIDADVTNI